MLRVTNLWCGAYYLFALHSDDVIAKPVRTPAVAISGVGFTAQLIITLEIPTLRSE